MAERDASTGRFLPGHKSISPGRKPRAVELKILATFNEVVTEEDWKDIIRTALKLAKRGDKWARDWLSDRVLGKPLQQIDIHAIAPEATNVIDVYEESRPLLEED